MKNSICNALVIICSLSLTMPIFDCTSENNVFGAGNGVFQIPDEYLSQTVEWEKCEFDETKRRWRKAECADITVPLHWDNPEGDTITIRVKGLRSLLKATKQMWWLDGIAGAGTADLPPYMTTFAQLDWKTDLYTLDHRGTGYSERLSCPVQEADDSEKGFRISESEWDACIAYLEATYNLDAFTVTQAAKDVGFLIELLKGENKEIFVYGVSYGTYLGQRYAQIFPDQAAGMIFDSVAPSVGSEIDQFDTDGNDVVKDFFDTCKGDAFCSNKMGSDPWGKVNATFEKFRNGHCAEVSEYGLDPELLQDLAFGALRYYDLRILLPAIYYRLERCSTEDVRAFKHLIDNVFPLFYPDEIPFTTRQSSTVLFYHLGLSELIGDNPMSPEEMREIAETLLASLHWSLKSLQLLERWPTYETDVYYHSWPSQDVPIVMLNGTLDHMTPIDVTRIAGENLTGQHQYFIEVPNATHGVIINSPVKNIFAPHCGVQIVLDYMNDPLKEPDTSCLDNLMPIDFRGNPLMALVFFGTWNLWE